MPCAQRVAVQWGRQGGTARSTSWAGYLGQGLGTMGTGLAGPTPTAGCCATGLINRRLLNG